MQMGTVTPHVVICSIREIYLNYCILASVSCFFFFFFVGVVNIDAFVELNKFKKKSLSICDNPFTGLVARLVLNNRC